MWQSRTWWRDPRICRICLTPWTQDKTPKTKFQKAWIHTNFMSHNWRQTSQLCQKPEHDTVDKISARWMLKSDGVSFALIVEPQAILRETLRHHSHQTFPSKDVPRLRWLPPFYNCNKDADLVAGQAFELLFFSLPCIQLYQPHHTWYRCMRWTPWRYDNCTNASSDAVTEKCECQGDYIQSTKVIFCKKQTKW